MSIPACGVEVSRTIPACDVNVSRTRPAFDVNVSRTRPACHCEEDRRTIHTEDGVPQWRLAE